MKKFLFVLTLPLLLCLSTYAQNEIYSYYFAVYEVGDGPMELMACKTQPYQYVSEKVTGMSGIGLIPEAKFRTWLNNTYGNKITSSAFYPATSADQAIGYYKDHVATYQQSKSQFKNSSYCPSIYTIAYVAPQKKATTNSNQNGNSGSTSNNTYSTNTGSSNSSTTNETDAQRQYREQRERIAAKQKADAEFSEQLVHGTTELVGMIGNMAAQNRKDREKKEAKKEAAKLEKEEQKKRDEEQRKRYIAIRQEKINELNNNLVYYLPQARQGNKNAINTVIEIYDKKTALNENSALNAKVAFLEEMYSINKSVVATAFLKDYYSKEIATYKKENKYHISRSIQNLLVGGAFYSIRIFVPKKYDVDGDRRETDNLMYRDVFGLGGATYFGITGIVHSFKIGKNKKKYIEANNKLKKLNSNSSTISFLPSYDLQQGSLGLAFVFKF